MIHLDHAASSPLRPEAAEAMRRWADVANPSSSHALGRAARAEIDRCREVVAVALGVSFGEVIFTSGGTEAVQSAILGAALARPGVPVRMSAVEHECALAVRPLLERLGHPVEILPVDAEGRLRPFELGDEILVAMGVNNEIGSLVLGDVPGFRVLDAVQTFGKRSLPEAPLTAVAAHKIGGPKGVGALVVRSGTPWTPWIAGHQERERRGGTENVAAISGFAAAIGAMRPDDGLIPARRLREGLIALGAVPTVAAPEGETIVHVRFPGRSSETLLVRLDRAGVAASAGAACASGAVEPSPVLLATGLGDREAREAIRFSTGWSTTESEVGEALGRIAGIV